MKRLLLILAVCISTLGFVAPSESQAFCGGGRPRVCRVLRAPVRVARAPFRLVRAIRHHRYHSGCRAGHVQAGVQRACDARCSR